MRIGIGQYGHLTGIRMVEPAGAHNPGKRAQIVEKPLDYQHHWPGCVSGYVGENQCDVLTG